MPREVLAREKEPLPTMAFESAGAWEAWLDENHAASAGLWLKFARKASGIPTVVYAEALEVALCYGWIDGQVRSLDDRYYLQRFTPRTARSKWSKVNCAKADALIAAGRLKPAGLRQVEAAKADGRWGAAYDSPRTASVPDDLRRALAKNKAAREFFDALNARNRYAILYMIQDAKRADTRARRVKKFVAMLAKGDKPHP